MEMNLINVRKELRARGRNQSWRLSPFPKAKSGAGRAWKCDSVCQPKGRYSPFCTYRGKGIGIGINLAVKKKKPKISKKKARVCE